MLRGVFSKDNGEIVFWNLRHPEGNGSGRPCLVLVINNEDSVCKFFDKTISESKINEFFNVVYNRGINGGILDGNLINVDIEKFLVLTKFLDDHNIPLNDYPKYLKSHDSIDLKRLDFVLKKFPEDGAEEILNYCSSCFVDDDRIDVLNMIAFIINDKEKSRYSHKKKYIAESHSKEFRARVNSPVSNFFPKVSSDYSIFDGLDPYQIEMVLVGSHFFKAEKDFQIQCFLTALQKTGQNFLGKKGESTNNRYSPNDMKSVDSMNWTVEDTYLEWFPRQYRPKVFTNLSYKLLRTCLFNNDDLRYSHINDFEVLSFWGAVQTLGLENFQILFSMLWNAAGKKLTKDRFFEICEQVHNVPDLLEVPQSVFEEMVLGSENE